MDVLDGRAPRARAGSLIQMGHWLQVASLRLEADQQKARTEDGGRSIKKDFAPVSRELVSTEFSRRSRLPGKA